MDQQIEQFIEGLVQQCLQSSQFVSLPPDQKQQKTQAIREYLYQTILDTLIDNMDMEQLNEFNTLDLSSPEAVTKIEQFAAEIPGFAPILEERLQKEVEQIKQTGQIPQQQ